MSGLALHSILCNSKAKKLPMKKLFILFFCIGALGVSSCKKDSPVSPINTVSTDYKGFVIEFTATWCPYCGTYGYPNWDPTFTAHPYKVTGISCHPADGLVNANYPEGDTLESIYGCTGYPTAGVNATGNGYPSDTYYNGLLNPAITANAQAKAGIGLKTTICGNTMTVDTKTVFFSDVSGKYNLAIYLTEDNLVYDQTTTTTSVLNAVHNHLFRGAAGHKAMGTQIVSSSASKGTQLDATYTVDIPSDVVNRSNLHVVVVLFKMNANGTRPTDVINSNTL